MHKKIPAYIFLNNDTTAYSYLMLSLYTIKLVYNTFIMDRDEIAI